MQIFFRKILILTLVIAISGVFYLPKPVEAASLAAGDLIKISSSSAVYYYTNNGSRYVFPNSKIYFSWYNNFNSVKTISDAAMAALPLGGNIFYRPGTRLIKIESDPKVYAVEPQGLLYWIESEQAAIALYGANWAKRVDDLSSAFFGDYYSVGELDGTIHPVGTLFKYAGSPIVYLLSQESGQIVKREISSEAFSTMRFKDENALVINSTYSYASGSAISSTDTKFNDSAQFSFARPSGLTITRLDSGNRVLDRDAIRVNLMKIRITSEEAATIKKLSFQIKAMTNEDDDKDAGGLVRGNNQDNLEPNITDFALEKDGVKIFGYAPIGITNDASQSFLFTGSHSITPRQAQEFWVTARIDADCPINEKFQLILWISGSEIVGSNNAPISKITPSDQLSSNELKVSEGSVQVTLGTGVGVSNIVGGGSLVNLAAFKLIFSGNGPLTLNKIALTGYIDENEGSSDFVKGKDADNTSTTSFGNVVEKLYLYYGEIKIAGPLNVDSSGYYVFEAINYTIASVDEFTFTVKGDISSSAPYENNFDQVAVDINYAATDVSVSSNGAGLTVSGDKPNNGASPTVYLKVRNNGILTFKNVEEVPEQSILAAGASQQIAAYTAEASYEDIEIGKLAFQNYYPESDDCIDHVSLSYTNKLGQAVAKSAYVDGSVAKFDSMGLMVPAGGKATFSLKLYTKTIDQGCDSGDKINFNLVPAQSFWAQGQSSSEYFDETHSNNVNYVVNQTKTNNYIVMRKTKPVIQLNGATPTGTGVRGVSELLRFDIAADSGGSVKIRKMIFQITASDVGALGDDSDLLEALADINGDFSDDNDIIDLYSTTNPSVYIGEGIGASIKYSIYDSSEKINDTTPAGLKTGGGDYGLITIEFNRGFELEIPAGQTRTYVLELDTSGLYRGAQTARMDLLSDESANGGFLWNDGKDENIGSARVKYFPLRGRQLNFE